LPLFGIEATALILLHRKLLTSHFFKFTIEFFGGTFGPKFEKVEKPFAEFDAK